MTKEKYKILLLDERWKKLSLSIKERDNFLCRKCKCKNNLQVHHIVYINKKNPWEYNDNQLITLCELCHKKEHAGKTSKDFLLKEKKTRKKIVISADYIKFQMKLEKSEEYYNNKLEKRNTDRINRINRSKKNKQSKN